MACVNSGAVLSSWDMTSPQVSRSIDAIWRIEAAHVIASLARMLRDVGLAEEFAQDALVIALEQWPRLGIPDRPGAWLLTTARHRAIDHLRRRNMLTRTHEMLGHELDMDQRDSNDPLAAVAREGIEDDLLRLIFVACHPILPRESRTALTLRLLGGLTIAEIARAFLAPESTISQRIVRAKRTLRDAKVSFEIPSPQERQSRLASVLEVIYLIFNEGYAATAGNDWMRPMLCEEALRIGRILAELAPAEAEVHGLVALMEIQASRLGARVDAHGDPILLLDQDRARWNQLLIQRGLHAMARGEALGELPGPYLLQAQIAACHARTATGSDTDWSAIERLYAELAAVTGSPVVELNRAVAVSMARGPAAGLELTDQLCAGGALDSYHLLPSVRGDLLQKLGRIEEARSEFERAATLTHNERERALLQRRAAACYIRGTV
jgi:RNA polymerase sigma factor (sigma-70 family)